MSKQSEAKAWQGYTTLQMHCSNCGRLTYDEEVLQDVFGGHYRKKSKVRCGLGGFAVKMTGTCNEWEAADTREEPKGPTILPPTNPERLLHVCEFDKSHTVWALFARNMTEPDTSPMYWTSMLLEYQAAVKFAQRLASQSRHMEYIMLGYTTAERIPNTVQGRKECKRPTPIPKST